MRWCRSACGSRSRIRSCPWCCSWCCSSLRYFWCGFSGGLSLPLYGAADRRDLLLRADALDGNLLHGLEQTVELAVILQLERCIEAEKLRRAHRAVGARRFLRLVDDVRKRKALRRRESLHVVERILGIVGRIVRRDRDRADAERRELAALAHHPVDHRLDVRAVVADEHHQQALVAARGDRAVAPAVHAEK